MKISTSCSKGVTPNSILISNEDYKLVIRNT